MLLAFTLWVATDPTRAATGQLTEQPDACAGGADAGDEYATAAALRVLARCTGHVGGVRDGTVADADLADWYKVGPLSAVRVRACATDGVVLRFQVHTREPIEGRDPARLLVVDDGALREFVADPLPPSSGPLPTEGVRKLLRALTPDGGPVPSPTAANILAPGECGWSVVYLRAPAEVRVQLAVVAGVGSYSIEAASCEGIELSECIDAARGV